MDTRQDKTVQDWTSSLKDTLRDYASPVDVATLESIERSMSRKAFRRRLAWVGGAVVAAVAAIIVVLATLPQDSVSVEETQRMASGKNASSGSQPGEAVESVRVAEVAKAQDKAIPKVAAKQDICPADSNADCKESVLESAEGISPLTEEKVLAETTEQTSDSQPELTEEPYEQHLSETSYEEFIMPERRRTSAWSLALAGIAGPDDNSNIPIYGTPLCLSAPSGVLEKRWHHTVPLTAGVKVSRRISPRFSVEAGLSYSLMHQQTDYVFIDETVNTEKLTYHFIGLPIGVKCDLLQSGVFNVYCGASVRFDRSVKIEGYFNSTNDDTIIVGNDSQDPINMVSTGISAGVGVSLGKHVSIFAEPELAYYLKATTPESFVLHEYPLCFRIQAGLKFNL